MTRLRSVAVELYEAIVRRRMVRNFGPRPVPADVVDRILSHALHAPSAGFTQGWEFLVLEQPADRARFWALASQPDWQSSSDRRRSVMSAPVLIVPFARRAAYAARYAEPDKASSRITTSGTWPAPYWTIDTAMATMLILLAAVEEGLGALFFAIFAEREAFLDAFGAPGDLEPIGAVALGYPAPDEASPSLRRGRRPLADVVHRGRW